MAAIPKPTYVKRAQAKVKRAEAALKKAQKAYDKALDEVNDAIVKWQKTWR